MAIDTVEKRKSVLGIHGPWTGTGVTPNAAKDQEWRQEAGYGYPGIAAGGQAFTATGAGVVDQITGTGAGTPGTLASGSGLVNLITGTGAGTPGAIMVGAGLVNLITGTGAVDTGTEAPDTATGGPGGRKRRRRRKYRGYPRTIIVDGRRITVHSAEEERQVLDAFKAELLAEREEEASDGAAPTAKVAQKQRVKIAAVNRRLAEVEERAQEWQRRIDEEDEEIILMLYQ